MFFHESKERCCSKVNFPDFRNNKYILIFSNGSGKIDKSKDL